MKKVPSIEIDEVQCKRTKLTEREREREERN